ncbi:MAG TPA: NACHT domain-containing protein [Candidatus Acidoferrales bacterium]|nr:NACHT domain-containing protein [Candidatus Acidoferrales bacterium]
MTDIKSKLDTTVVRPIFDSVHPNGRRDQSLPEVVFDNRRSRAYLRVLDALTSRGAPTVPKGLRTRLESMIETWSTQAFDDAFQPIQEFEIQCARERDLVVAEQSGDPRRVLEVRESEYRRRVAARFGFIELRGIQLNHRVILDLDQVYVPLHFEKLGNRTKDGKRQIVLSKSPSRVPIAEIIEENARILLIGSPGSGKSTLLSFLASRCAVGRHGLSWPDRALPFVITVRELKDAELSPKWLAAQLEIAPDLVSAALSQERAVLLVDGLDEAPNELRQQLVAALAEFTKDHPKTPVIVTSRPAGAPGEIESCLPGFQGFRLADLTNDEVSEFIDRWCLAAERSARPDSSEAEKQASAAAADLKSRIKRSRPVQRIAVNPLLTTILCVVHRFLGRTIPEHRVTLYEKCTDALLYEWDRAKFPKDAAVGNLDANQKRALLRGVASALHENHEAEIPESEVVRHFAAMLPQMGKPQEDALRIVREIRDRTGVLVERRPGVFAFSHLTFQEYLTALDYASRSEQLLEHLDDPWWHEVIALAVGIPGCDPVRIISALVRKEEDRDAVILAAKCLETAIHIPLDLRKDVEDGLEGILPPQDWEFAERLREIGLTVAPILARGLLNYNAIGKVNSLVFFNGFEYEPAIPLVVQLALDTEPSPIGIDNYFPTLGEFAIFMLSDMSKTSESAKRALASVLSKPQSEEFLQILDLGEILGDDFKPSRPGKRSSKRAKSTV